MIKGRSKIKVLLANSPFKELWNVAKGTKTCYIGYLCIASVLEKNNIEVQILDGFLEGLSPEEFLERVEKIAPDVVGMGAFTPWANSTLRTFRRIKELDKDIITVAGGEHFTYLPELYAREPSIDFVVIGEGEYTFLELMQELMKPTPDFKSIKGIAYSDNGQYVQTPPRPFIEDLNTLPMPAYHLVPLEKSEMWAGWKNFIRIKPSRGCSNRCSFCAQWKMYNGTFRTRSGDSILKEIDLLYNKYGMTTISIDDESFNADRKRTETLVNGLLERKYSLHIECSPRADHIVRDADFIPKLAEAGLSTCVIGIETYVEGILKEEKKGEGIEQIKSCFKLLRENHIGTVGTYIVGRMNDTKESIKRALDHVNEVNPDAILFCALVPWPGSQLWEELLKTGRITDFNFFHYDLLHSVVKTENLSIEEVSEYGNWLIAQFYAPEFKRMRILHCGDAYWRHTMRNWFNHQDDLYIKVPPRQEIVPSFDKALDFE